MAAAQVIRTGSVVQLIGADPMVKFRVIRIERSFGLAHLKRMPTSYDPIVLEDVDLPIYLDELVRWDQRDR